VTVKFIYWGKAEILPHSYSCKTPAAL